MMAWFSPWRQALAVPVFIFIGAGALGCMRHNPEEPDAGVTTTDAGSPDLAQPPPLVRDLSLERPHDLARPVLRDMGRGPDLSLIPDPPMVHQLPGVTVATLAGSSTAGSMEGTGATAQFDNPVGIVLDTSGRLYVTEYDGNRVREVDVNGTTLTLVPPGTLYCPFAIVECNADDLIVQTDCDAGGGKTSTSGTLWRVPKSGDPPVQLVTGLNRPRGLARIDDNNVAVSDRIHETLSQLSVSDGTLSLLAGALDVAGYVDATGAAARFDDPYGLALSTDGAVLVADDFNNRLRKVTLGGVVTTWAGAADVGAVDGPRVLARFFGPKALAVDGNGDIFVSDALNHRIRRVGADGIVVTIAGDGAMGFRDGSGDQAEFYGQEGIAVSSDGKTVWVADGNLGDGSDHHRVRIITIP